MPIYLDVSAAVHRRAGLGHYAENSVCALQSLLGEDLVFCYRCSDNLLDSRL